MNRPFTILAAMAVLLTGCSARDQRNASTGANDAYLVTAVGTKLAAIDVDAVTRVHIAADNGVITLSGQARSAQERAQYEDAAKSVSGVRAVDDEVSINPHAEGLRGQAADAALTARISAAIAGQAGVNAFHVQPSVHRGHVALRGRVPTQAIHQTILQTVRAIAGVKSIDDELTVGAQ
jgi:osmotically-inducible protein OsmY